MRILLLTFILLFSSYSVASSFSCTAEVFESFDDGTSRHEKVPLNVESENSAHISLSADLDGRGFTLSGNKNEGPYFASITQEPDYTKGSLTTADFSKEGRLQISTVQGRLVHKLECFKSDK